MINGNYKGIKETVKKRLEALEDRQTDASYFLDAGLAEELAALTAILGREICVYLSRSGKISYVGLGSDDRADLVSMRVRRSLERLSGYRCIHTHPNGVGSLSEIDLQSLRTMRFDAVCAVGVTDRGMTDISMAVLDDTPEGYTVHHASHFSKIDQQAWLNAIEEADQKIRPRELASQASEKERVMIIGHESDSLDELARLVDTAGGEAVFRALQKNVKGTIGSGKMNELSLTAQKESVDLAVYDDELTAVEQRSMEEGLGIPVIDRTALILDIFAMRASTKEGKMQVELAQLQYRLSRLKGEGLALSRQGGGIGTRGPGEAKLETDRRYINRRIYELKDQLAHLSQRRGLMRKQRQKQELPQVALVGYTNAGKSTLLKALSGSEVFCEDKLFATLDPLTRRVSLDKSIEICLTDTVGFIKKLPHTLVEAFRSTLEEAVFADVLLHVCDGSDPAVFSQAEAVGQVLAEIGAADLPTVIVVNKTDRITGERPPFKGAVYISAQTGEGLDELRRVLIEEVKKQSAEATVTVPYARGDVLAYIHAHAKVLTEEHGETGTTVTFSAPGDEVKRILAKL